MLWCKWCGFRAVVKRRGDIPAIRRGEPTEQEAAPKP